MTVAPSGQTAALSDWMGSYWRGWVGRHRSGPEDLRRPALEIAQRNSALAVDAAPLFRLATAFR